jgi:hypothetical protein
MNPISLEIVQRQIDSADAKQIVTLLANVAAWDVHKHDPNDIDRKAEAQEHIQAVLYATDQAQAVGYARAFLQRHSETAAARGGFTS